MSDSNASSMWKQRELARRPRLLIFDDGIDVNELGRFVENFKERGYDAVGVAVLDEFEEAQFIKPDCTLDQPALTAAITKAESPAIRKRLETLTKYTFAISNLDQLPSLLQQSRPDALLSDRDMSGTELEDGHRIFAGLPEPYSKLPKAMHTGGEITADDQECAARGGYPLFSKRGADDKIDAYFRKALRDSQPPLPG